MRDKWLLGLPLKLLNLCGMSPLNQTIYSKTRSVSFIAICVYLFLEFVIQFVFNWKGWDSLDEFAVWSSIYQMISKGTVMAVNRSDFLSIVLSVRKFWSWKQFGDDFRHKIETIHKTVRKFALLFIFGAFTTITAYLLKPLFSNIRTLPFDTYHPINRYDFPAYELMYGFQVFVAASGCCCIVSFDVLFLFLIVHIVCEIKIIKEGFLSLVDDVKIEDACLSEMKKLVRHHNDVLKCVKDLDKVYSAVLLNQFACSMFGICIGLLSIIANGFPPDVQRFSKYSTYLMSLFCQLFIYCSAGTYLTAECESVSTSAYGSNWWIRTQSRLRKSFVLVIQRSNKGDKLTAGGMFTVNLENFTNIVKTSMSFFTLVQAMFTRGDYK